VSAGAADDQVRAEPVHGKGDLEAGVELVERFRGDQQEREPVGEGDAATFRYVARVHPPEHPIGHVDDAPRGAEVLADPRRRRLLHHRPLHPVVPDAGLDPRPLAPGDRERERLHARRGEHEPLPLDARHDPREARLLPLRDHPPGRVDHHPAAVVADPEVIQLGRFERDPARRFERIDVQLGQDCGGRARVGGPARFHFGGPQSGRPGTVIRFRRHGVAWVRAVRACGPGAHFPILPQNAMR